MITTQKNTTKRREQYNEQVISRERVVEHGEVYTHEREVTAMLNLVEAETQRIESRFLEPACGTGNFLIQVLKRKLAVVSKRYKKNQFEFEAYAMLALSSIYGIELLQDNVFACRARLFNYFEKVYRNTYKNKINNQFLESAKYLLSKNIIWGDALTLKVVENPQQDIIFSQWSLHKKRFFKRLDFSYANLLSIEGENKEAAEDLFEPVATVDKAFLHKPVAEYKLIDFLQLGKEKQILFDDYC